MKIYLFNPESGVYLGEDFADEVAMQRGAFLLPPYATTIAPPPVDPGQVPVFIVAEQCWIARAFQRISPPPPFIEEVEPDDKLDL